MSYKCQHCTKEFKNLYILNNHIKTAKYCLVLQGKIKKKQPLYMCNICEKNLSSKRNLEYHICKKDEDLLKCNLCDKLISSKQRFEEHKKKCKKIIINCKYCDEIFDTNNNLIIHETKCIKKFEYMINEIKVELEKTKSECKLEIEKIKHEYKSELEKKEHEYKLEVKDLQDKLERIAIKGVEKPTNQITNNKYTYLTSLNFTKDEIKDKIESKFTLDYFLEGQKGVADFTYDNLLLDEEGNTKYICADASRGIYMYKNQKGEYEKDIKSKKLTQVIVKDIISKSDKIYDDEIKKYEKEKNNDMIYIYRNNLLDIHKLKSDNKKFENTISYLTLSNTKNDMLKDENNNTEIYDNSDSFSDNNSNSYNDNNSDSCSSNNSDNNSHNNSDSCSDTNIELENQNDSDSESIIKEIDNKNEIIDEEYFEIKYKLLEELDKSSEFYNIYKNKLDKEKKIFLKKKKNIK